MTDGRAARGGAASLPGGRSARGHLSHSPESGAFLLVAAVGIVVTAAVAQTAVTGLVRPMSAFSFGGLIALGELFRLALPGGRESAPVAVAGAMGYALVREAAAQSPWQVIAVAAAGMTLGALPHLAADHPVGLPAMASRLIGITVVAFGYRSLVTALPLGTDWWLRLGVMAGLLVVGWAAECLVRALVRADALHARFGVALWDELRVQLPLGVAVSATAVLIALAEQMMGVTALGVFIVPLLVTQVALRRYTGIRATYLETVRALARVTEVGGYVEDGHAHRVGQLAVAVGRELGMGEQHLLELEYAALMHDIGQLSLRDTIPGGATVLASPQAQRSIAEMGAAVISQAGGLDGVAEIVRCQSWPCRGPGGEPPVGSRIIRAANAFDDLVGTSADLGRTTAALERLRLGTGAEYDPAVVDALAKVARRRPL